MAEIQLAKIKSIYGDIKGLLSEIPSPDKEKLVNDFTVKMFNDVIDELSQVSNTDYSKYKIPNSQHTRPWPDMYASVIVRAQIGRVVSRLETEFGFGREHERQQSPSIVILNKNQNEISLQINYTINDLVDKIDNEEGKIQLRELRDELEKPAKNWEKIKAILIWILNFSKDLFLEVLPIILQKKL